eukprot:6207640-Pleurochrysis_carterae.AAC.4
MYGFTIELIGQAVHVTARAGQGILFVQWIVTAQNLSARLPSPLPSFLASLESLLFNRTVTFSSYVCLD